MPNELPIRCECGSLRGIARGLAPDEGNRVVCYCDDCQSFAHFLGGEEKILDAHGGTDIFQTSPARIEFTQGLDRLACMRLTPGGLVRWYASCCRTPIGNTLATRQVPFVGLILRCLDPDGVAGSRDAVLGPVRARIQARFAKGGRDSLDAHEGMSLPMVLRFGRLLLSARLGGDHKRSPFFDPGTGELVVRPGVLAPDELHEVEAARDRA